MKSLFLVLVLMCCWACGDEASASNPCFHEDGVSLWCYEDTFNDGNSCTFHGTIVGDECRGQCVYAGQTEDETYSYLGTMNADGDMELDGKVFFYCTNLLD